MKLIQLRHFLALAEYGNFHRAANALHITQQALSASVSNLEKGLNAALFTRGPSGVALTSSGERLSHRAKLICSEAQRAEMELREIEDPRFGTVRIGVGAFFAERLVPLLLADYLDDFPDLSITLIQAPSQELFNMLGHGEIDFSLSTPTPGLRIPLDIDSEVLFTMPMALHLCADHRLLWPDTLKLENLVDEPWVVSPAHADKLSAAFAESGKGEPRRMIRTDSLPVARFLVAERNYIMLGADAPAALRLFAPDMVVTRDVPEFHEPIEAVLAWRNSSQLLPSARRLLRHASGVFRAAAEAT